MMGMRFTLVSTDGEILETIKTSVAVWQTGDDLWASGARHFRVVSVIPVERVSEFVDEPIGGVLEVEPLQGPL